jgi:glycosyltransferase involved in cell wall biosynthesis
LIYINSINENELITLRILFLSQLIPYPPDAGPKVRSYYTLRYLSQTHQITLVAFSRPDDPPDALHYLNEFCTEIFTVPIIRSRWRDLKAIVMSYYNADSFIIRRDSVPEMYHLLENLLDVNEYDAVHSDQLWMAQYAMHAKNNGHPTMTYVLDEHNACFQIYQRLASREENPFKRMFLDREWRKLKKYEAWTCSQFDSLVTVTHEDRYLLDELINNRSAPGNNKKSYTIPICVDTNAIEPIINFQNSSNVLHMGTMFWLPNVEGVLWFSHEVWSRIIEEVPQATFTIVGKNPPRSIRELDPNNYQAGESSFASTLTKGKGSIQVTGYVQDPKPYLERAGIFIVPLLSGGGMRVKIIDAWRWGLPVVSTSVGAEGISYIDGENILIADDPVDFANAVVRVLNDPVLAQRLRRNGRKWVEDHYDWRKVYKAWDEIYP